MPMDAIDNYKITQEMNKLWFAIDRNTNDIAEVVMALPNDCQCLTTQEDTPAQLGSYVWLLTHTFRGETTICGLFDSEDKAKEEQARLAKENGWTNGFFEVQDWVVQ